MIKSASLSHNASSILDSSRCTISFLCDHSRAESFLLCLTARANWLKIMPSDNYWYKLDGKTLVEVLQSQKDSNPPIASSTQSESKSLEIIAIKDAEIADLRRRLAIEEKKSDHYAKKAFTPKKYGQTQTKKRQTMPIFNCSRPEPCYCQNETGQMKTQTWRNTMGNSATYWKSN